MNSISKELLMELYVSKRLTMKEISSELHVSVGTVFNQMHKFGIKPRSRSDYAGSRHITEQHREIIRKTHTGKIVSDHQKKLQSEKAKLRVGEKAPHYNGGRHRTDGYLQVKIPNHPKSDCEGYVMQHRAVMENKLGRLLEADEVVHHVNGKRDDNRIENLKLMTFKEHAGYHMSQRQAARRKGEI